MNSREGITFTLILLYIPFRNESDLIGKQETAEAAFSRQLSANPMLSDHHQRLQVALEAHKKVHAINEARALLQEAPVPQVPEDGLVQGEAKTAMEDVYQLNDCPSEAVKLMIWLLSSTGIKYEYLIVLSPILSTKRDMKMVNALAQVCSHCTCS